MIRDLPTFMRGSSILNQVFNAEGRQFDKQGYRILDIHRQMNLETATWALDIYEREHGIRVDRRKPYEERRSVLRSRIRGTGLVSADMIKAVADSYTNGDVDVDFLGYILITFTSRIGRPPNLVDVTQALEDVVPAHLRIEYAFRYLTIGEISTRTIEEVQGMTLGKFAGGEAVGN